MVVAQPRTEALVRLRSASVPLAFVIYSYLMPAAMAEPVPFSCTILPDGKSVRVAISNPFDRETSCQVNCQFSTTSRGTSFQLSCTNNVAAGGKDVQLCVRDLSEGTLVKMTGGDGNCIKQLSEEELKAREKKSDEDADAEMKKAMKQGDDMLNRMKASKPLTEEERQEQEKKSRENAEDELNKAMKQGEDLMKGLNEDKPN
jgi:hypothetical protein